MSIKVVQGLLGKPEVSQTNSPLITPAQGPSQAAQVQSALAASVTHAITSTEAVITTLRVNKGGLQAPEKIRDAKKAKEVADDVSKRIRGSEEGVEDHHKLDGERTKPELLSNR